MYAISLGLYTSFSLSYPFHIISSGTNMQMAIVALAGPMLNLILYIFSKLSVKLRIFNSEFDPYMIMCSRINIFLFIFNIMPIPGFDGWQFISHILKAFA